MSSFGLTDPLGNARGSVFYQTPAGYESIGGGYLAYNMPPQYGNGYEIVNLSASPDRNDVPAYNNHAGAMASSPFNGASEAADARLRLAPSVPLSAVSVPLASAITVTTTSQTRRSVSRDTSPPSSMAPESDDDETALFSAALVRHAARELGVDYVPSTGTLPSYKNGSPQDNRLGQGSWASRHQSIHQTRKILQTHTDVTFNDDDIDPLGAAPLTDDPWKGDHYLIGMSPDYRFLVSGEMGEEPFINSTELDRQIELREKALGPKHLSIAALRLQLAEHYFACATNRRYARRSADAIAARGGVDGSGTIVGPKASRLAESQLLQVVDIFTERFGGPLAKELVPVYSKLGGFYMASKQFEKASGSFEMAKKCADRCAVEEKEREEYRLVSGPQQQANTASTINADGTINLSYAPQSAAQLANRKLRTLLGALRDSGAASQFASPVRDARRNSVPDHPANATDEVAKALARTAIAQFIADGSVTDLSVINQVNHVNTSASEVDEDFRSVREEGTRGKPMPFTDSDRALLRNPMYTHESLSMLMNSAEAGLQRPPPPKPHITTSTQMVLDQALATANRLRDQRLHEEAKLAEEVKASLAAQQRNEPVVSALSKNGSYSAANYGSPVRIRFQFPSPQTTSNTHEHLTSHIGSVIESVSKAGLGRDDDGNTGSSNSRSSTPFTHGLRLTNASNNSHGYRVANVSSGNSYDLDADEVAVVARPSGRVPGAGNVIAETPLSTFRFNTSSTGPESAPREGSVMLEIANMILKQSQQVV